MYVYIVVFGLTDKVYINWLEKKSLFLLFFARKASKLHYFYLETLGID